MLVTRVQGPAAQDYLEKSVHVQNEWMKQYFGVTVWNVNMNDTSFYAFFLKT